MSRPDPAEPSPERRGRRRNTQETLGHFLSGLAAEQTPGRPAGLRPGTGVDAPRMAGQLLRQSLSEGEAAVVVARVAAILRAPMTTAEKPHWNASTQELWWMGVVTRCFRDDAVNQCAVLAAFEEAGWPPRIPDPLPRNRRGNAKRRRWQTIQSLNRGLSPHTLRFAADGVGGFRWEAII